MFLFRINKLRILNNRKLIGKADLKLVSFITTSDNSLPDMDEYIATNDPDKKRKIVQKAIQSVISAKVTPTIQKITDNAIITFGDTGYSLYTADKIPAIFNWQFIAYRNKDRERTNAQLAEAIIKDDSFDGFSENIGTLIGAASNPAFAVGVEVVKFVTDTTLKIMASENDAEIGFVLMTLDRDEHYPHGERKIDNVPDATGNMFFDYSIFGMEN